MFVNLFGNYLIKNGKITSEQFADIKECQNKTRVKLGLIAVAQNMITEKQADEINRKQAVLDKRFGDIAVDLGYLTGEQVSSLLDLQGNAYMLFCQTVTDKGILTLSEIDEALSAYIAEIGLDEANITGFKADDIDSIIPAFLPGCGKRSAELISVVLRTFTRLISSELYIDKGSKIDSFEADHFAYQSIEGDCSLSTGFVGEGNSLLVIADNFAGEEFEYVDEDALDSVGEFINIVNGLYATNLSYQKIKVELMPPVLSIEKSSMEGRDIYELPLYLDDNKMKLVIAAK